MSRHVFEQDGIRTVVGWDPPLKTYFFQQGAIDPKTDTWVNGDHGPEIWVGTDLEEIPTRLALVSKCWENGVKLDSTWFEVLESDQEQDI